jgi:hypothetical protein
MAMLFGRQSGSDAGAESNYSSTLEVIDALYTLEMKSNIAALGQRRRSARLHRSMAQWSSYWPVALGIAVSFFAPQMRAFVEPYRPWGLWLGFPMAALSIQPGVHLGSWMSSTLPTALLYLQFPLEGLLAKVAQRDKVTVYGVALQVLYFHALCFIDLWLLNGGLHRLMGR